ncbi:MAG TPA: Clp protease N-terminal domain-containing protein, partial [Salinivirgaceae bacterium]|nr:Clp protease N-terminal domain-containing protein [Salinivirgaceae bacterium]
MEAKFSQKLKDIILYSREEAVRLGNTTLEPDHLFLGLIRDGNNEALQLLFTLGLAKVQIYEFKERIEQKLGSKSSLDINETDELTFNHGTTRVFRLAVLEARRFSSEEILPEHMLLAILRDESALITKFFFMELGIQYDDILELVKNSSPENKMNNPFGGSDDDDDSDDMEENSSTSKGSSETPVLDNFGVDLTQAAAENRLDPIVGREVEIERLSQILSRRKKNNPVLIGEPGVGKSAIVEGLA